MPNKNVRNIQKIIYEDDDKNTKLHYEAASGNLEEVTKIIESGCDIDCANFLGWTPVLMATRNGHSEVVRYLFEKRADSTRENQFGYNILLMAVASGNMEILHVILQHLLCGGVSRRSLQRVLSPVSLAVLFGYQQVLEYLIQHNFCVNAIGLNTKLTPLTFANIMGNPQIIQILISKGATPTDTSMLSDKEPIHLTVPAHSVVERSPMILVTTPQIPPHFFSPMFTHPMDMTRKCSDLHTPVFTPHISPYTPNPHHQIFFPSDFSPNHFISPINGVPYLGHPDILNLSILHSPYSTMTPVFLPQFNAV